MSKVTEIGCIEQIQRANRMNGADIHKSQKRTNWANEHKRMNWIKKNERIDQI